MNAQKQIKVDAIEFFEAYTRDGNIRNTIPKSAYVDLLTGKIVWVHDTDSGCQREWGTDAVLSNSQRRIAVSDQARYLFIPSDRTHYGDENLSRMGICFLAENGIQPEWSEPPIEEEMAYHQAGHAVANELLGLRTIRVSIVNDDGRFGRCLSPRSLVYHYTKKQELRRIGRDQIVATYSDWEAEVRYSPNANPQWSEEDFDSVADHAQDCDVHPRSCKYPGDDAHLKYLRQLQLEAKKLVLEHWAKIEVVAKALLERKQLTGAEVITLIEPVEPDRTSR